MALTLTVGTNTYVTRAEATTYFEGSLHAAAWVAASDTTKDQALVTAARMMNRQYWQGEKTSSSQALAWPRTGVKDKEGNELSSSTVPTDIKDGQCELALSLIQNAETQTQTSNTSNIKRVQAGSASVEYFKTAKGGRFPTIVQELVGYLLSSSSDGLLDGYASGVDQEPYFDGNTFDLNGGFS